MQRFEDAVVATATRPMSTQYGEGSVVGEKVAGRWVRADGKGSRMEREAGAVDKRGLQVIGFVLGRASR
jgi:hypothetical protein